MKICSIYDHRPKQCKDHDFPTTFCPMGIDVLKVDRAEAARIVQRNDFILYNKKD
jgi:Fe-S-cluster containining protein